MTTALLAFALTATLLILAPGPDSMLVMRNTLRRGRSAGWITACGTLSGLLVWAVAATLGLSALLRVSHLGYDILRLAGAAYLIWLGATSLWPRGRRAHPARPDAVPGPRTHPAHPAHSGRVDPGAGAPPGPGAHPAHPGREDPSGVPAGRAWRGRMYLNGLLSNLLNPKIGVFFIAFLPGFIPVRASAAAFSLVFGLWFIAETGAWLVILAWLVARGAGWLRGSALQRWAERVTGVVLIGFGLRLAAEVR
jgi:threonine/homoserine/homoserine lactone efflux protein